MAGELLRCGRRGVVLASLMAASLPLLRAARADDLAQSRRHWVASWQGSPQTFDPLLSSLVPLQPSYNNQTLREIVHISVGGPKIRLRLTNSYGTQPLVVGAVHVARAGEGSTIRGSTDRTVSFGGENGIPIPPGAVAVNDPMDLAVPALADLAVSIYVPQDTGPATQHTLGVQTSDVTTGDATGAAGFPVGSATTILTRPS